LTKAGKILDRVAGTRIIQKPVGEDDTDSIEYHDKQIAQGITPSIRV
jgi:hypothetical protein